jgi:hypothetical protein
MTFTHPGGVSVAYPSDWQITTLAGSGIRFSLPIKTDLLSSQAPNYIVQFNVYERPLADRAIADPHTWSPNEGRVEITWEKPICVPGAEGLLFLWGSHNLNAVLYNEKEELDVRLSTSLDLESFQMTGQIGLDAVILQRFHVFNHMVGSIRFEHTTDDSGCVTPTEQTPSSAFSGEFSVEKALRLLYGADRVVVADNGAVYAEIQSTQFTKRGGAIDATVRPNLAAPYRQSGTDKYILITETSPTDPAYHCHACPTLIGGAVFLRAGDTWKAETEQETITFIGSFASAPSGELVQIGPDAYGVLFRDTYVGQGYFTDWTHVIAVVGESFKTVLTLAAASGPVSSEAATGYSSEIEFVPSEHPVYYDVRVVTNGTRFQDDTLVQYSEDKTLAFSEQELEYVEQIPSDG